MKEFRIDIKIYQNYLKLSCVTYTKMLIIVLFTSTTIASNFNKGILALIWINIILSGVIIQKDWLKVYF